MKNIIRRAKVNLSLLMITGSCIAGAIAAPIKHLEDSWYVGGAVGYSLLDPKTPESAKVTEDSDVSMKVYAGIDVTSQLGLEAFFVDMGSSAVTGAAGNGDIKYSAVGVNGIYHLPIYAGKVHPFGKLGLAKINTKITGSVVENKQNDFSVFGGLGAVYDVSDQWKIRAEYDYYTKDISQLNVGVNWSPTGRKHYLDTRAVEKLPQALPFNFNFQKKAPVRRPIVKKVVKKSPVYKPQSKPRSKPRVRTVVQTHDTSLSGESLFATGSARLMPGGIRELDNLVTKTLGMGFKLYHLTISGHTDDRGSYNNNLRLSKSRAEAVAQYLGAKGIRRNMMSVVGHGESLPIASNTTAYGRSINRRVEIKVKGAQSYVSAAR